MSKVIENNVVQMSFDNKDFEKNISTSTKSVEKLSKELEFKDASKGFQNLEKYANSVNFDGLNKAIGNINSVFTVTGNLTKKIIDDIAGYFESKIVGTVNSVRNTIGYIMDTDLGISKYEQYTNAIKIMTANLADEDKKRSKNQIADGIVSDEIGFVENYVEKLALYTDETSYSLTDMVDTMAKFAANNVDLQKSTAAMMGFANMAAVAGQNATVASQGMMQMSQAFSTGYIKYQDWMQAFSLKNIATKEAKEVFVKKALEIGTLDEADIKEAQRVNGENWVNYFFTSDTLNKGWLRTSDVLVEGLSEYSKASDYILKNMENISETASVTDVLRWVEDYKKSGLSAEAFAASLGDSVDNADALAVALKKLTSEEFELSLKAFNAAQNATNFHEAIDAVRDAVGTKMMYALRYFIGDLDQARTLWTNFANSLWDVFAGPLDNALAGLRRFNEEVYRTEEVNGQLIEFTLYDDFWNNVGNLFGGIGNLFGKLADQFRIVTGAVKEVGHGISEPMSFISKYTYNFMESVTLGIGAMSDKIEAFGESGLFQSMVGTFANVLRIIKNIKSITASFFGATAGTILKNIGKPLKAISDIVFEISLRVEDSTKRLSKSKVFNELMGAISRLTSKLVELGTYLIGRFGNMLFRILDGVSSLAAKLIDFLIPGIEALIAFIDDSVIPFIDDIIEGNNLIGQGFEFITDTLGDLLPKLSTFITDITGMSWDEVGKKVSNFADGFIADVKRIGSQGFDVLKQFFKDSLDPKVEGSWADLFNIVKNADSVSEGAQNVVSWAGDALSRPITLIFDLLSVVAGKDLSGIANDITWFIKKVANSLAGITPDIFSGIKVVFDIIIDLLKAVGYVFLQVIQYLSGIKDTTGFQVLDDVLYGFKTIFVSIVEVIGYLLKSLGDLIKYMTPNILSAIDYIKDMCIKIVEWMKDMFSQFKDIDDPDQMLDYVKTALKFFAALFLFVSIYSLIYNIVWVFNTLGKGFKVLSRAVNIVADSVSEVLESLSGNTVPGMMRVLSFMMISFGYALSAIVKAGEAFKDPAVAKGAIMAVLMMLVLVKALTSAAITLIKYQSKAYTDLSKAITAKEKATNRLNKYTTPGQGGIIYNIKSSIYSTFFAKKDMAAMDGDIDQMRKDAKLTQNSFKEIGSLIAGLAVGLLAISASIAILAKASKGTSPKDILVAGATIGLILVALTYFLKEVKGKRNDYTEITKSAAKFKRQGDTYKGVASSLLAFGMAVFMLAVPLAILAHTSKKVGLVNMGAAAGVIAGIIKIFGDMIATITKESKGKGFMESFGVVLIIKALSGMLVVFALAIGGLALALNYIDPKVIPALIAISSIIALALAAIATIIAIMISKLEDFDLKREFKHLVMAISRLVMASVVFTSLGLVFGAIGVSLYLLTKAIQSNREAYNSKLPYDLLAALGIIIILMGIVFAFVKNLASSFKNYGTAKSTLAKIGALSLIILTVGGFIVTIAGIMLGLALAIKAFGISGEIWQAFGVIAAIVVALGLLMLGMAEITKILGGGKKADKGANVIVKMAGAIFVIIAAIAALSVVLIGLGAAFSFFKSDLWVGLGFLAASLVVLAGAVFLLSKVGTLGYKGIMVVAKALLAIAAVVAVVMAAVFLFVTCGDALFEWLQDRAPKIREHFRIIGNAFGDLLVGLVEGINTVLPDLIKAVMECIAIILNALGDTIGPVVEALVYLLAAVLAGIGEAIKKNAGPIVDGIWSIVEGLLKLAGKAIKKLFPTQITRTVVKLAQDMAYDLDKIDEDLHNDMIRREAELQKDLYEMRRKGAEHYLEIMEHVANMEAYIAETSSLDDLSPEERRQLEIRKSVITTSKNKLANEAERAFNYYGVDVTSSVEENRKNNKYLQKYDEEYNYENPGEARAFAETESIIEKLAGTGISGGLALAGNFLSSFKDGLGNLKDSELGSLLGGFSTDSNVLASITSDGNALGMLSGESYMQGFENSVDFSTVPGLDKVDMNGYSEIPSMDDYMNQDSIMGTAMYDAQIDTEVSDNQVKQISEAAETSNNDVCSEIRRLSDEIKQYIEIYRNIQMYLDTGVLVGELVVPLDRALGEKSSLKERRGI